MRKLILEPLHSEYILMKISASDLDEPFPWKTSELREEQNFERWDILHSVLLNWLLSKEKSKYVMMFYNEDMEDKQRDWLRKCIKLSEWLPELLMIEQKKRLMIEYGKYLIILTWKFDWMYIKDWKVHIIDLKTAAKKMDYEDKIQLKIYWFLNNVSNIEYRVFNKDANPKLSIYPFEINLEQNKKDVVIKIIEYVENKYWYVNNNIKKQFIFNSHQWEYQ